MVAVGKKRLNGTLDTPPTPSRRDRRRAIEHYRHPSGEPLPGGPLPVSEWPAALARFSVLEPYGATCYFSYFTESIGELDPAAWPCSNGAFEEHGGHEEQRPATACAASPTGTSAERKPGTAAP